jgi:hypothetical protein
MTELGSLHIRHGPRRSEADVGAMAIIHSAFVDAAAAADDVEKGDLAEPCQRLIDAIALTIRRRNILS